MIVSWVAIRRAVAKGVLESGGWEFSLEHRLLRVLSVSSVAGYCYRTACQGVNAIPPILRALVRSLRRY